MQSRAELDVVGICRGVTQSCPNEGVLQGMLRYTLITAIISLCVALIMIFNTEETRPESISYFSKYRSHTHTPKFI